MKRVAGIVLIFGVICFVIGVTRIENFDWSTANIGSRIRYIEENPDQWQFGNLMMGLSGIIVTVGIVTFTFSLRQRTEDIKLILIAIASAISVSLAAATWMFICYSRISLPPSEVALNLGIKNWTGSTFTIPFVLGNVLLGFVIMQRYSKWGGGLTIAVEVLLVVYMYNVFRDVIPATHFLPLFIAGLALFNVKSKSLTSV
jgi:hypothetical protein